MTLDHRAAIGSLRSSRQAVVRAVEDKLRQARLTLYRVAFLSKQRHPGQNAYHIRRNFYFQVRSGLSPTLEQVVAFAELTTTPIPDWLAVFGFSLSDIPRLQAALARPATGLIDANLADKGALLPSFEYRRPQETPATTAPLSHLLKPSGAEDVSVFLEHASRNFVYAKLGKADRLAYPQVVPGSIIRADPSLIPSHLPQTAGELSRHVFLIRLASGLCCARLRAIARDRFAPAGPDSQVHSAVLRFDTELRILGVVDLEFRFSGLSTRSSQGKSLSRNAAAVTETRLIRPVKAPVGPGTLLGQARIASGLSFRAASEKSREVVAALGDPRYFASPGTLSDYEAQQTLPRHIHKLFTVAVVYALSFRELLGSVGIQLDAAISSDEGKTAGRGRWSDEIRSANFLEDLFNRFGDVPLFLTSALSSLTGLARPSMRDAFWIAGPTGQGHPPLAGALFALINRRSKNPRFYARTPLHLQPVYLLQERGGSCYLANCALEGGRLVVYADSQTPALLPPVSRDAEVLGEVVAMARGLAGSTAPASVS